MADRVEGNKLDLLRRLELSPQSETPDIVKEWTILSFDNADIDNLPESLGRCVNVESVSAQSNRLSSLPQSISNLSLLTYLDLSENAFTTFPIALCGMTNLRNLNLNYNQLSDLPEEISGMTDLLRFDIGSNNFSIFPTALFKMCNLKILSLTGNQLSYIPVEISRMAALEILFLFDNCFTAFPTALCGMANLEILNIVNNQISNLPVEISSMTGLREFILRNNCFTTFPNALCSMTTLKKLDLGHNQISDIPADIVAMTGLESLDLRSNNITHLPPQIGNMKSLVEFNVMGNPLVQPPEHIADRGLDAIKRYFEALTTTEAILSSRIQVNFLGETEAGKTSLSHTLQRGRSTLTEEADRTRMVEQGTWVYDQNISFNINDFGGHNVYKIGHPIFTSKRGLVLITFDLSEYDPENKAHYQLYIGNWIDMVQAQMPGIRIAVVGTHVDIDKAYSAKWSIIKKQFQDHRHKKQKWYESQIKTIEKKILNTDETQTSILQAYEDKRSRLMASQDQAKDIHDGIFGVSCKTMEGIEELQNFLTTVARERAVVLPEMWVDAAKNIRIKKYEGFDNTLDWDKIQDIILQSAPASWKEKNTSKEDLDSATCDILSFLADRGDIIWFDSSPTLKKVVFHRQEVLANVLKAVLNHDSDAVRAKLQQSMSISKPKAKIIHDYIFSRGIISREAMDCLCEPFRLSTTEADVLVELMQKLELCYQVQEDPLAPSSISFHFPWLLTLKRQPELDEKWPSKVPTDTTQLTLQINFPYRCPDGTFEKLSVRQHKHLGLLKTKRIDWKDGVYAEFQEGQIQISRQERHQQLDTESIIIIAVRGPRPNLSGMWSILSCVHGDLMTIIKEDWPGVSYDKYLVCPHCVNENPTLFPTEAQYEPLTTVQDPKVAPSTGKRFREWAPTLFPGEILDLTELPDGVSKPRHVPCVNTGVYIPADLVYPPHLVMSWREVVTKNKDALKENITERDLLDMIDLLFEKGIFSNRECERIKESPEKTAVFLDFLTKTPDRAHQILCQWLEEQGKTHILEPIQPAGPSMLHAPIASASSTKFQPEEELLMSRVPDFIDKEVLEKMIRDVVPYDERKKMGAVIQRNCSDLQKKYPNISRISISRQEADEDGEKKPCIAIYCSDLTNISEFPKKLEDYPVEVREGTFLLNADSEGSIDNDHSQLHIGCSVGLPSRQGSLGVFVNHHRGDPASTKPQAFLTCSHVVCPYGSSLETAINKSVYVENNHTFKRCGFVSKCYAGNVEFDNGFGSKGPYGVDIALVELHKNAEANLFPIHHQNTSFSNVEIVDIRCFFKDELVFMHKFGKTTGLTHGVVNSEYDYCCDPTLIDGTSGVPKQFLNMITVKSIPTPDKPAFSEEGDSGSAVFVECNNGKRVIIGTVVGSSPGKEHYSFVSQIHPSLHTMNACIYKPPPMEGAMQMEEAPQREEEEEMETG